MPHNMIRFILYASEVLKKDPTFIPDLILSRTTVIGILSAEWYPDPDIKWVIWNLDNFD